MTAPVAPFGPALDGVPRTAARHYELCVLGAVLRLRSLLPDPETVPSVPMTFLRRYLDQLPAWGRVERRDDAAAAAAAWCAAVEAWEDRATADARPWMRAEQDPPPAAHLPLAALRTEAGLGWTGISVLLLAGLPDEDPRFGDLFAALQRDGTRRPTAGLLGGWTDDPDARAAVRVAVRALHDLGAVDAPAAGTELATSGLRPVGPLWEVVRGATSVVLPHGIVHHPAADARPLEDLVLDAATRRHAAALPALLGGGAVRSLIVRGPSSTGRGTLVAAIARGLGRGTLVVPPEGAHAWHALGALATAAGAMPVLRLDPGPGETVDVPAMPGYSGPLAIVLPGHGGVAGTGAAAPITISLGMPTPGQRAAHWREVLGSEPGHPDALADDLAARYRLPGGTIRRAASIALSIAALEGRSTVTAPDVAAACRTIRDRALESLAPRMEVGGGWEDLVVDADTLAELRLLEARCRGRERLVDALPAALAPTTAGVRALFSGPSGTGKTLAARILASELGMDLHVVQLGSVVDKYLGESEKRLATLFERAAALNAILLLDEGDSLMTRRTDVSSSNDRWANLQTNHLLQLLEAHDGIVLVTTNAAERIDGAFLRRIDVIVELRAPDAAGRWQLWQRHLPPGHRVEDGTLQDIATRCELTGGQIRNAALHASLLAMPESDGAPSPSSRHVDAAVRREYRKLGAVCPLRPEPAWP